MTERDIIASITFLADSLFIGLRVIVPALIITWFALPPVHKLKIREARQACDFLLVTGGILFLVVFTAKTLEAFVSGNEYDREFLISIATGPGWFQFFTPLVNYGLLPMLLWNRKLRNSAYTTPIIVLVWLTSWFWMDYFTRQVFGNFASNRPLDVREYSFKAILFIVFFSVTWIFVRSKNRRK